MKYYIYISNVLDWSKSNKLSTQKYDWGKEQILKNSSTFTLLLTYIKV